MQELPHNAGLGATNGSRRSSNGATPVEKTVISLIGNEASGAKKEQHKQATYELRTSGVLRTSYTPMVHIYGTVDAGSAMKQRPFTDMLQKQYAIWGTPGFHVKHMTAVLRGRGCCTAAQLEKRELGAAVEIPCGSDPPTHPCSKLIPS